MILRPKQTPARWVPGLFPESKAPGAWSNPSPPHTVEVKNEWSLTSSRPICLHNEEKEIINIYTHKQVRTKKERTYICIIIYSNILVYEAVSSGEYL